MRFSRLGVTGVLLAVLSLMLATSASAAGVKVCVPAKEGKPIVTPKAGVCKTGYTLTELGGEGKEGKEGKEGPAGNEGKEGKAGPEGKSPFSAEETATLKAILPYVRFVSSGVGSKPTIQFSGANIQIVNGAGKTDTVNGTGNLVIGYDEIFSEEKQTGSHDLVMGRNQESTSYGGIIAGFNGKISAPFASVLGGTGNRAESNGASVSGGGGNRAAGEYASVSGGSGNASTGKYTSVTGGSSNQATGFTSSISGGGFVTAAGSFSWVGGGYKNSTPFELSSVFGGKEISTKSTYEALP